MLSFVLPLRLRSKFDHTIIDQSAIVVKCFKSLLLPVFGFPTLSLLAFLFCLIWPPLCAFRLEVVERYETQFFSSKKKNTEIPDCL